MSSPSLSPPQLLTVGAECGKEKALVLCQPCWAVGRALGCYQGWFIHNYTPQHLSSATEGTPLLPSQPLLFLSPELFPSLARPFSWDTPLSPTRDQLYQPPFTPAMTLLIDSSGCSPIPAVLLPVAVPGCGMRWSCNSPCSPRARKYLPLILQLISALKKGCIVSEFHLGHRTSHPSVPAKQ